MKSIIRLSVLLLSVISLLPVIAAPNKLHIGKAGIYMRTAPVERDNPNLRQVALANPLVDCFVLGFTWSELEPEPGKFDLTKIHRSVKEWSATGKHVVIHILMYGQHTDDTVTPSWVFKQKDVQTVSFAGGGVARGSKVTVPVVWTDEFNQRYAKPLVKQLAKEFDGDPSVWYIHPALGHIGNLTAQPSKSGGPAFIKAGWTADKWKEHVLRTEALYRGYFRKTPIIVFSSPLLIRNKQHNNYTFEALDLCKSLARNGDAVAFFGADAAPKRMALIRSTAQDLSSIAKQGMCRLGMGDDWPLWVPESRRTNPPTVGFDDNNLKQSLQNCFAQGKETFPTTIIYLCSPEILASSPASPGALRGKNAECFYRPAVAAIIKAARTQLMSNDKLCFGSPAASK